MAYVNGEWLDRRSREEQIVQIRSNISMYRKLLKAGALTESDMSAFESDLDLLEKLERVHRAEHDHLFYMYEYFSEDRNPGNPDNLIPAGMNVLSAAEFHKTLCGMLDAITNGDVKSNVAWSVGRGHAKTAYLSNGYLCAKVAYRHERYIVEVSETTDVAGDFIRWTANQLKFNRKLIEDFGVLLHERTSMNTADNKYEFITTTGTKVEAKGIGTQMRGLRHGAARVGLFLLDDLESKSNTNTPELRKKNKDWFREEMLPALSREGMAIYMGTIVHFDSLLNYVLKERRDFISNKFPAVLEWTQREDLWEDWRKIYRLDRADAVQLAQEFYETNKEDMIRGTRVLWPERFDYLYLMMKRENEGAKAFNQEYLGNPIDEESQVFKPEDIHYFLEDEAPDELEYFMGVDFAMGKENGDYSAAIVVGKSPNGVHYVMDTFIERVHPDVLLNKCVDMALDWQLDGLAVEAQQAQEWFADKLSEALQAAGYPGRTRLKQVKQRNRKSLRIESMLPDIQNGRIRFQRTQRMMLQQLELYPMDHDDGPDALHMAISAAKSNHVTVRTSRKRTR